MIYSHSYLAIIGIFGLLIWALEFWNIFKVAQLYIPEKILTKKYSLSKFFVFFIGCIAWLLLSYSMAGPKKTAGFIKNKAEINDIIFVVDVSRSMLAEDFTPNRLEVAKSKILDFIKLRPTDRIGIVIFSEKAFTLLPLTTDLKLINKIVDEIKVGFLGSGTNIGDALGLAVARGIQSLAKNKVIVLLTDGVSNVGSITPLEAAENAKKNNIKVYTIGVGGKESALIPVKNNRGKKVYQSIPGGNIDLNVLSQISKITNGKSYQATSESALIKVLSEIEKLERTKIDISGSIIYKELYWKYLVFGLSLLLLAELLRRVWLREVT